MQEFWNSHERGRIFSNASSASLGKDYIGKSFECLYLVMHLPCGKSKETDVADLKAVSGGRGNRLGR